MYQVQSIYGAWTVVDPNGIPVRAYGARRKAAQIEADRRNKRDNQEAKRAAEEAAREADSINYGGYDR